MRHPSNPRSGQTLIEALIALSILTVGFLGIVTLLTKSFQLNRITSDDTQATYLAAEGIEVVKSLIDHDVYSGLADSTSTDAFGTCFPLAGYYYPIDYYTTDCAGLNFSVAKQDTPLYFNPTTNTFSSNAFAASATDFVRSIKVTTSDNSDGLPVDIDVQSTVTWTSGLLSDTITLEDHFYNWHP